MTEGDNRRGAPGMWGLPLKVCPLRSYLSELKQTSSELTISKLDHPSGLRACFQFYLCVPQYIVMFQVKALYNNIM